MIPDSTDAGQQGSLNTDNTERFLDTLFGDLPDGWHFALTRRQGWQTRFFTSIPPALPMAARWASSDDVYVCAGLHRVARIDGKRGDADAVDGIVGLWLDLDLANEGHKKPGNFATLDEAQAFLDRLPLRPTVTVLSGGGIQAHLLFREPWLFDNDAERDKAKALAAGWIDYCRAEAQKIDRSVDATKSLAQVLRLPGTINHKYPHKPQVRLQYIDPEARYNPSDFQEYVTTGEPGASQARPAGPVVPGVPVGTLILNPQADPPFKKFEALRANDDRFQRTWDHTRKDGVKKNWSASEWDLSLAHQLVQAEWTDQEIVDTLIAGRACHAEDLKLRPEYYGSTIAKARSGHAETLASEAIDAHVLGVDTADATPDDAAAHKAALLSHLSTVLHVPITRILKFTGSNEIYRMETAKGTITFGTAGFFESRTQFRRAFMKTRHLIPSMSRKQWDTLLKIMLEVLEEVELGPDADDAQLFRSYVCSYSRDHAPFRLDRPDKAPSRSHARDFISGAPFIRHGCVHLHVGSLQKWLLVQYSHDRDLVRGIAMKLKDLGGQDSP